MSDLSVVGRSLAALDEEARAKAGRLIHVEHEETPAALSRRDD